VIDRSFALLSFDEMLVSVGARARETRLRQNLSQDQLARKAGVGIATIQRFEKDGHASMQNALRIAFALGAESGFDGLFELPEYASLDEALARPQETKRRRARKRK
jgi:transcriptional regulator with XRE-family HTH domain